MGNAQTIESNKESTIESTVKPVVESTVEPTTELTVKQVLESTVKPVVEPTVKQVIEPTVKLVAEQKIDIDDFVIYLNSLWSSDNNFESDINNLPVDNPSNEILDKFKKDIEEKYDSIKVICNFTYTNNLEKEVRLSKRDLTKDDIKLSYIAFKDLLSHNKINTQTMNKINKVFVSDKIKDVNKSKLELKNYRFIQVHSKPLKLLDRLWCMRVLNKIKTLDTTIFKSNLLKGMTDSVITVADQNTQSTTNVILIDIEKAFDSCEYDIIEDLIKSNLKRRTNEIFANNLTEQYMYILKNRELFFKDNKVTYKKGLPTGFPSSNLVFSLIMDEIIFRWSKENDGLFTIGVDFKLNIYVDDIYIKLNNLNIKDPLVISLIDILQKYKFKVNFEKCKADANLQLDFFTNLQENDMYLGIPFTRNIKLYSDIILKKYNKYETYKSIYDKLKNENHLERKQIFGYFNYKLKPLMKDSELISFIEKNLLSL